MKRILIFTFTIILLSFFSSCATTEKCPGVATTENIKFEN